MKKKVKDCTIEELEKHFIKKFDLEPTHIEIYWYDVRFFTVENDIIPKYFLYKDEEIEVF